MGNVIKINCRKVYENGVYYLQKEEDIKNIKKDLETISKNIEAAWKGGDDYNFLVSFNRHIEELGPIMDFLYNNGKILKRNALEHNGIDNNFSVSMERSVLK